MATLTKWTIFDFSSRTEKKSKFLSFNGLKSTFKEKIVFFFFAGAEERMAVVWERAVRSGRIDAMRFVAVTSTNAAKMFNMYPKKGRIAVGADADLVIWDASGKRVLESSRAQSSQENSMYDGLTVHSVVTATIVGGKIAYQNGEVREAPVAGGFLRLSPNSPYLFSMVGQRDKVSRV